MCCMSMHVFMLGQWRYLGEHCMHMDSGPQKPMLQWIDSSLRSQKKIPPPPLVSNNMHTNYKLICRNCTGSRVDRRTTFFQRWFHKAVLSGDGLFMEVAGMSGCPQVGSLRKWGLPLNQLLRIVAMWGEPWSVSNVELAALRPILCCWATGFVPSS